ncbi:MAG: helix-turn-helix transcriptional regulator, partial [Caldilinea sp.]
MHAVRKHILAILKESGGATVAELAEQLQMAPVSVRHHLDILQGDNLIRVGRTERTGSVGRPQQIYELTEEADEFFPDNFALLAAGMVRQLKQLLPPEQVEVVFRSLAKEMTAGIDVVELAQLPLAERLDRVTLFLNDHGYLARWEAAPTSDPTSDAGEFVLYKHNCPYAGISNEHRELCMMDQMLIDRLVGTPCDRTASVANNDLCCAYRIRQPATLAPIDWPA